MRQTIYLVASRHGIERMTKRLPSLNRGEAGVLLKITIPDEVFKNPLITAALDVMEEHVVRPTITIEQGHVPHGQDEDLPHPAEAPDGEAGEGEVPTPEPERPDGIDPQ